GLGVMAGLARSQDHLPPGPPLTPGTPLPPPALTTTPSEASGVVPLSPQLDAPGMGGPPAPYAEFDPSVFNYVPMKDPQRGWIRRPAGCYTHHNRFSCGSWGSELRFLFGSCRAFFGEPCLKPPVPVGEPVPGLRLPPDGSGGSGGCNCP